MEKNVFEEIIPQEKLPAEAREEVLQSIERAKLLLDFWDLFAPKRIAVNLNAINQTQTNQKSLKK